MFFLPPPALPQRSKRTTPSVRCSYDTILIGSGLSSLSTAALLHHYLPGHKTLLLEAHTTPGGAAHVFRRRCRDGVITFEVGPHLFSGLRAGDNNPVGQLFQVLGIQPEILTYDTWGVILGDRAVTTKVPGDVLLGELLSEQGRLEMCALCEGLKPYCEAAKALSIACIRGDVGVLRILLPRLGGLLKHARYTGALGKPFKTVLDRFVQDELTYNLVNMLCFLLAGVGAERIPTAEVAFMFSEWCAGEGGGAGGVLQRPVGGGAGIVDQLLRYIKAQGGTIRTRAPVERILVEGGAAKGVRLRNGEVIPAGRVISSVSSIDHARLLGLDAEGSYDVCDSFLHLHLAFKDDGSVGSLEPNYAVVEDIFDDIERPGNLVLVSIPSVVDDIAPSGWVVLHAYTPATEPWAPWAGLSEGTAEYTRYKEGRAEVLWKAVNKIFGREMRELAEVVAVGSPRTHERFLFRARGSYGTRVDARTGMAAPGWNGGVRGLLTVGDAVFPGVGVPAVVGSAWIAANCCVGVGRQIEVLRELGL